MNNKWLRVILISAAGASLIFPLSSCAPGSESASAKESDTVAVARGDITIDITAAGNLAYSQQEDLSFDMAGTVEEVPVEVGDSVTEGQALATLDSSAFEDNLSALQDQVTARERSLLQAQISLKNAETALDNAKNPYTADEIKQAKQELALAEQQLRYDLQHGPESSVLRDQQDVYAKQQAYDDMVDGGDEDDIAMKQMQYDLALGQMTDSEKALTDAQKDLTDAQDDSPELAAPFNGFITQVNISGGDEITKGTVAAQIADPTRFEATLLVSEMDIFKVKLGGEAQVTVDALSGIRLPAKVTAISPTASIQAGVVNYEVTVEVEPLATIRQQQQEAAQARQDELSNLAPGELPERLQQAVDAGRLTLEQAAAMVTQMQEGGGQFQTGGQSQTPSGTTLFATDFELKEGLSVTVSIVIQQATDVLIVPNRAISFQAGESHVQVIAADGTTEDRAIQTGIKDYQYTEVTSGLTEGEQIIVPQVTATTPSAPSTTQGFSRQGGGAFMIPGEGPPR